MTNHKLWLHKLVKITPIAQKIIHFSPTVRRLRGCFIQPFRTKLGQWKVRMLPEKSPCWSYGVSFNERFIHFHLCNNEKPHTDLIPFQPDWKSHRQSLPTTLHSCNRQSIHQQTTVRKEGNKNTSHTSERRWIMARGYSGPFQPSSSSLHPHSTCQPPWCCPQVLTAVAALLIVILIITMMMMMMMK